jgi:hypothetical protein
MAGPALFLGGAGGLVAIFEMPEPGSPALIGLCAAAGVACILCIPLGLIVGASMLPGAREPRGGAGYSEANAYRDWESRY